MLVRKPGIIPVIHFYGFVSLITLWVCFLLTLCGFVYLSILMESILFLYIGRLASYIGWT